MTSNFNEIMLLSSNAVYIIVNQNFEIIDYKNCLRNEEKIFPSKLENGCPLLQILPAELITEIAKYTTKNESASFNFPVNLNKKEIWLNVSLTAQNNNIFVIVLTNVTEQKENEFYYQDVFNNAVMGIYRSTPGLGKHVNVNPELAKIYGYDNQEDLIESVTDISHQLFSDPHRRDEFIEILEKVGKCESFESEVIKKNGEKIWISENAGAVKNKNGEIEYIVGTVKDITEQKIIENELIQAKEDWENTFDAINEIVIILDVELKIRRVNRAGKNLLKISSPEPSGKFCFNLTNCGTENCQRCPASLTMKDKIAHTAEIENVLLGKFFLSTASPIYDKNGNFTGVVYVAKDISEEKKLQKESEFRLQQVIHADKLKSLGEMVASVAHEINNPVGYMIYNLELIKESWSRLENFYRIDENNSIDNYKEVVEEFPELIYSIENGTNRIKKIVEKLKKFTRGNLSPNFCFTELNQIVSDAFDIINAKVKSSGIEIKFNLDSENPVIFGDSQQIQQVIINLISNALQALNNKKNGYIKIQTKSIARLGCSVVEIEDNGDGIEPSNITKIYEPFFTTRRNSGGTGLGLSISYEIVKSHSALLTVHSKQNIGTCFSIYLPANKGVELKVTPQILCVEDAPEIINKLQWALSQSNDLASLFANEESEIIPTLENHPEIDILLINSQIAANCTELLAMINKNYPLIEIILYSFSKIEDAKIFPAFAKKIELGSNTDILIKLLKTTNRINL